MHQNTARLPRDSRKESLGNAAAPKQEVTQNERSPNNANSIISEIDRILEKAKRSNQTQVSPNSKNGTTRYGPTNGLPRNVSRDSRTNFQSKERSKVLTDFDSGKSDGKLIQKSKLHPNNGLLNQANLNVSLSLISSTQPSGSVQFPSTTQSRPRRSISDMKQQQSVPSSASTQGTRLHIRSSQQQNRQSVSPPIDVHAPLGNVQNPLMSSSEEIKVTKFTRSFYNDPEHQKFVREKMRQRRLIEENRLRALRDFEESTRKEQREMEESNALKKTAMSIERQNQILQRMASSHKTDTSSNIAFLEKIQRGTPLFIEMEKKFQEEKVKKLEESRINNSKRRKQTLQDEINSHQLAYFQQLIESNSRKSAKQVRLTQSAEKKRPVSKFFLICENERMEQLQLEKEKMQQKLINQQRKEEFSKNLKTNLSQKEIKLPSGALGDHIEEKKDKKLSQKFIQQTFMTQDMVSPQKKKERSTEENQLTSEKSNRSPEDSSKKQRKRNSTSKSFQFNSISELSKNVSDLQFLNERTPQTTKNVQVAAVDAADSHIFDKSESRRNRSSSNKKDTSLNKREYVRKFETNQEDPEEKVNVNHLVSIKKSYKRRNGNESTKNFLESNSKQYSKELRGVEGEEVGSLLGPSEIKYTVLSPSQISVENISSSSNRKRIDRQRRLIEKVTSSTLPMPKLLLNMDEKGESAVSSKRVAISPEESMLSRQKNYAALFRMSDHSLNSKLNDRNVSIQEKMRNVQLETQKMEFIAKRSERVLFQNKSAIEEITDHASSHAIEGLGRELLSDIYITSICAKLSLLDQIIQPKDGNAEPEKEDKQSIATGQKHMNASPVGKTAF